MVALNLNNHFELKKKDLEISALTLRIEDSTHKVEELQDTVGGLKLNIKESAESYHRLSKKVGSLSSKESDYSQNIKKVEENVETKKLLDTPLPDDLRRLLNESVRIE